VNTTFGLGVTVVPKPPQGPAVRIKQEAWDHQPDGRTSVRFFTNEARELKPRRFPTDPPPGQYYTRDRDLGQTFTTPARAPFRLTAVTLRTGPADDAVGADAPGAAVSLQLFAVSGTAVIHHNHTPTDQRDDYITGESYESLLVVTGGTLPERLRRDQWLRWELPADGSVVLQPGTRYAFLLLFDEPAHRRELALANLYHGPSDFGEHGIRREGSVAEPWRDPNWVNNREASSLPLDWDVRLAQQPGTWGRPDVDTYRVLTVYIEGE
jgi:hypothetical protein